MKLWLIAKSNMRKKKGNVAILFLLVLIATTLLYSSIDTVMNIGSFLDEKNESQNGAHACVIASDSHREEVEEILKAPSDYREMESELVLNEIGTSDIRNVTQDGKKQSIPFIFQDMSLNRTISNYKIVDEAEEKKENSIVLPMYLKVSEGYQSGDEITISFRNQKETFEIYGFIEDVMFATPSNITVYRCMLMHDKFVQLQDEEPSLVPMRMYNIRLADMTKSKDYENAISKDLNKIDDPAFACEYILNYMLMRDAGSVFVNILMALMAIFSIFIILIALVVIRFSIATSLEDNLPNVGISEALGYTTTQLIQATALEYLVVVICGIAAGFGFAVGVSGFVADVISGSIGLSWKIKVDYFAAVITVFLIVLLISAILFAATRKYKKITPLDALRGGVSTHNFKKNYMPLDKSSFGIHTSLGIKSLIQARKRNLAVLFLIVLLVYTCTIMYGMYYNFVGDKTALVDLVGIEKRTVQINCKEGSSTNNTEALERLETELKTWDEIELTNRTGNMQIVIVGENQEMPVDASIYRSLDDLKVKKLIEGRNPKHSNEIIMTNVLAKRFGLQCGSSITLRKGNVTKSYVVVGITQQISQMGIAMAMSEEAMQELDAGYQPQALCIYMKPGYGTPDDLVHDINEYLGENNQFSVVNFEESYDAILKTFTGSIETVCIVFTGITSLVVILIVLFTVRMKLVKERKQIGIYKALGYTTGQVVWQIVMSFSPVVVTGAAIGTLLGMATSNQLVVLMLSISGIEKANLICSPAVLMLSFGGVSLLGIIVAILCSLQSRKIEPYKMIVEG